MSLEFRRNQLWDEVMELDFPRLTHNNTQQIFLELLNYWMNYRF